MASAYTKTTFLEAVLLSALPVVFAHGGDEAMDMEGMISEHSQDPSIDPISLPPSYFSHPNGKGTIYLHITLMSLAWVLVLPVGEFDILHIRNGLETRCLHFHQP